MAKASHYPLYPHLSLTKLKQGREVREAPTRVKHRNIVPLAKASLEMPY